MQAREVLDVTLAILYSPNNKEKRLGLNVPADWASALELLKKYSELKTDMKADRVLHERIRAGMIANIWRQGGRSSTRPPARRD